MLPTEKHKKKAKTHEISIRLVAERAKNRLAET